MTDETTQPAEPLSIAAPDDRAITLGDLAVRINAKNDMVITALHSALGYALNAGDLLIEAKRLLKHGQWLPWLAANCSIPPRTVSHYMALAKHRAEFCDENGNLLPISVRHALDVLHPEDETDPAAPETIEPVIIRSEVTHTTHEMQIPSYDTDPRDNGTSEPPPSQETTAATSPPRSQEATAVTPSRYDETERLVAALDDADRMITNNREKAERGGQRFFSGTLRLARAMKEARDEFQSDRDFRKWLKKGGLDRGNDYAILLKLAEYPEDAMRRVIEQLHSFERVLEELQPELDTAGKTESPKPGATLH